MHKKLLSWTEMMKGHVNNKVPMSKKVFQAKLSQDQIFDDTLGALPADTVNDINAKIADEFEKQNVDLSNENIRGVAADAVGTCLKTSECLSLNLSSNFLRDSDITLLSKNLHHRSIKLEDLDLSNNRIGIQGAKVLAEVLVYNRSLRSLNLDTNGITASGIEKLAQSLSKNTNLQCFSVNWNNLHVFAEDFYFTLSKNKSLVTMQLGYCNLNDSVAEAFADGLRENSTLRELYLFGNQISDLGAMQLENALEENDSLFYLNLEYNLITDDSALNFIDLIKQKKERRLELSVNLFHNQLSEDIENQLQSIRENQLRKPTVFLSEMNNDTASDVSVRRDTISLFVNNRFYQIDHEEDSHDDESDQDVATDDEEGSVIMSNNYVIDP